MLVKFAEFFIRSSAQGSSCSISTQARLDAAQAAEQTNTRHASDKEIPLSDSFSLNRNSATLPLQNILVKLGQK